MILAAGLTPAWQQILRFDHLQLGEVSRAREAHWCASGKVLNVGLALHHVGAEAITLSPLGGLPGEAIRHEFAAAGIAARWIDCQRPTRVCTTMIQPPDEDRTASPGRQEPRFPPCVTELVENAAPLSDGELSCFRAAFAELAGEARWMIVSGSLAAGAPAEIYADLLARHGERAILDIRGLELLRALECRPRLVKLNRDELGQTVGRALGDEGALQSAMDEILRAGARAIAVTQGAGSVWLATTGETWRLTPPHVDVINPIGSGDSMTAAIAWGLGDGASLVETVRLGVAAGAENAAALLPARLNLHRVRELASHVVAERVDR